jgi:hypothetical protein
MPNPTLAIPEPRPVRGVSSLGRTAAALLRLAGWTVWLAEPIPRRAVVVVYPHTSNWDFVVGLLAKWALGLDLSFFGKDSLFRGWFGRWLRRLGGIPVDRSAPGGLVERMAGEFARRERFLLAITPEGTRGYVHGWRSGFYRIARAAGVPVGLAFIDYRTRRVGVGAYVELTGDPELDWQAFAGFYAGMQGRRPGSQSPVSPLERSPSDTGPAAR